MRVTILMMLIKYRRGTRGPRSVLVGLWLLGFTLIGCSRHTSEAAAATSSAAEWPSAVPQAHYAHLFGKRYRTKVDLYLFARNNADSRFLSGNLPAKVSRRNRGRTYGMIKILDVVPRGSELTIHAETHDVTPFSGIQGSPGIAMGFICGLSYDGKQMDDILSEFIQLHTAVAGAVPNQEIDTSIAAPIED